MVPIASDKALEVVEGRGRAELEVALQGSKNEAESW